MGGAMVVPRGKSFANGGEQALDKMNRVNHAKALINALVNNLDTARQSAIFNTKSNQDLALEMVLEGAVLIAYLHNMPSNADSSCPLDDLSRQAVVTFLRKEQCDVYLYFFEAVEALDEPGAIFENLSAKLYTDFFIGFSCPLTELPADMIHTITESIMKDFANKELLVPLLLDAQSKALEIILRDATTYRHREALRSKIYFETFVLIVDSNPVLLKKYAADLLDRGFMVDVARTGQEAVTKMLAKEYSGVLIDYKLSDLSAIEVTKQVRAGGKAWCKSMPIVGMSHAKRLGMEAECLFFGMNALEMKPPDMHHFVAYLQKVELKALFAARKSVKKALLCTRAGSDKKLCVESVKQAAFQPVMI